MELLGAMGPDDPPVAAWTTVTEPALVLGRMARDPQLDREAIAADGVTVVRRSSGGGPVLWDADLLALDVVLPRDHPLAPGDVVQAYRWLGEALAGALRGLGLPDVEVVSIAAARAAQREPGAAADACFGGLSPFEVTAAGRKVVGLSQTRRRTGTLLQAGLPLRLDADRLARLMGRGPGFARALAASAAGLAELAPGLRARDVVAAADQALATHDGRWGA